ncbi:hypothetical protein BFW01_g10365 [Lasiodiplodia theobromae]|uniref:adenine phosphoribosyltransferase n=1 Tax=Lasiodiplodia theobromae TaxID=45133 RepID=A0A8H7IPZ6_9PEZI|nr:hypothetical protein BFW01_g10365 [Lasiodiplodia theobromae]
MRDKAPVATFSHLVPGSRLLEVHVQASEVMRRMNRWVHSCDDDGDNDKDGDSSKSNLTALEHRPSLIFNNDKIGKEAVERFAEHCLLPFFDEKLQRLADMVRTVPDFPRSGVDFRHVLGISEHSDGLALCSSLLQTHYAGDWAKVSTVVSCEAGGFVFASALALRVDVPLVLVREAGKLPPPTVTVIKPQSYVSSLSPNSQKEKRIEMGRGAVPRGAPVLVVDDVLSTGETLCAVLQLLIEDGISAEDVSVMTVAEFPIHRGRELLRRRGFGGVNIQSLLVFGGS